MDPASRGGDITGEPPDPVVYPSLKAALGTPHIKPFTSDLMDSLRGFSSFVVMFAHVCQIYALPYFGLKGRLENTVSLVASYCVMTFFVVSGFMISHSVMKNIGLDGRFVAHRFVQARLIRIYPPLLASIFLTALIVLSINVLGLHGSDTYRMAGDLYVARDAADITVVEIVNTVTLSYGVVHGIGGPINFNGPLWSLSYEAWFYLLAGLLVYGYYRRTFACALAGSILALFIFAIPATDLFWAFLAIWGGGYIMGLAYQNRLGLLALVGSAVPLILLALWLALLLHEGSNLIASFVHPYGNLELLVLIFWTFTFALYRATLAEDSRKLPYVMNMFGRTAKFSYTLYLIHFPLLMLGFSLSHPVTHDLGWPISVVVGIISGVAVLPLASVLSRYVEDRKGVRRLIAKILERGLSRRVTL